MKRTFAYLTESRGRVVTLVMYGIYIYLLARKFIWLLTDQKSLILSFIKNFLRKIGLLAQVKPKPA